jgi:hypothetical protein
VEVVQSRAQDMTVPRLWGAAGFWGGARGWNADQFGRLSSSPLVRPFGVWNAWGGGWVRFVGTLLGPEGAGFWFVASGRAFLHSVPSPPLWGCPGLAGSCGGCLVVR